MSSSENSPEAPIKFKPVKKKSLRTRIKEESSDGDASDDETPETVAKLDETKELQRLRRRPNGVSVVGLATGQKISLEQELIAKDPFKVKTGGGMVDMKRLKHGGKPAAAADDAYDTGIGTQFSAETNKRDEDDEMMKYIDDRLAERKGDVEGAKEGTAVDPNRYLSPEEAALQSLPDHLRHSSAHRSEEMLSNQMLSGIPEVDLGIEAKIKNIEATEEAKLRLLWERRNRQEAPSQFVPTNMAVNFVQHNRFNIDADPPRRKRHHRGGEEGEDKAKGVEDKAAAAVVPGNAPDLPRKGGAGKKEKGEKATDDYHYEKFKKQFRRY